MHAITSAGLGNGDELVLGPGTCLRGLYVHVSRRYNRE